MKQSNDCTSRRAPMLYRSPSKPPGGQKRIAFSSHGPPSVSHNRGVHTTFPEIEKEVNGTPRSSVVAKVSPVTLMNDSSEISSSSDYLFPVLNPKPKTKNDEPLALTLSPNHRLNDSGFNPPAGRSIRSNSCALSHPMMKEMPSVQNVSFRSPMLSSKHKMLSESPGSSFSRNTKPAISSVSSMTDTAWSGFDSDDLSKSLTPIHCTTNKKIKTVPITLVSPSPFSNKRNQGSYTRKENISPVLSSNKLLSLEFQRPTYLSLKRVDPFLSPRPQNTYAGDRFTSQAAVATMKRPVSTHRSPFEDSRDASPMMLLSPTIKEKSPLKNDAEDISSLRYLPLPINFHSVNDNDGKKENGTSTNGDECIQRRSLMQTSESLFNPIRTLSNGALNEMMYPNHGGLDGSFSDGDEDETNNFFLLDPSCLLPPPPCKSTAYMFSEKSNNQGDVSSNTRNLDSSLLSSGQSSSLKRVRSDQCISSLGLGLEDHVCSGQYSNRDLITPPVDTHEMSSPPPLKKTKKNISMPLAKDEYT